MKRIGILITLGLVFAGCVDDGKGPAAAAADGEGNKFSQVDTQQLPYQGPAGGERADTTHPNMPASIADNGSTASAFPKTFPPAKS